MKPNSSFSSEVSVSEEALDLYRKSLKIDLHVDSFIWTRIFGYDLCKQHGLGLLRGRLFFQTDLPRLHEQGIHPYLSITTNPFRLKKKRLSILHENLRSIKKMISSFPHAVLASSILDLDKAQREGKIACFLAIQGGNALEALAPDFDSIPPEISRVTLVHMLRSNIGGNSLTNSKRGLTSIGRDLVKTLNYKKILVDLAHASVACFWDTISIQDSAQPVIVSHTGAYETHPHRRNIDHEQAKAVAKSGGVIGVFFQSGFLSGFRRLFGTKTCDIVVDHIVQLINTTNVDSVGIGTDADGMICPPRDLVSSTGWAVLVQRMLERSFTHEEIKKVLGENARRVIQKIRPIKSISK